MKNGVIASFLVLILVVATTVVLWKQPWQAKRPTIFFPGEINKFSINNVSVEKANNQWMVDGIPADSESAATTADKLGQLKLADVASVNPDRFKDLGFDPSQRVVVEISGKKIELGNINSSYDGVYVKEVDKNIVYNTDIYLEKNNLTDENYWVNKTITQLPVLQIKKVMVGNKEVKDTKMIEKLANLKAVKYLPDSSGLTVQRTFNIQTDEATTVLKIGQKILNWKNKIFWATTDDKFYYEMSPEDFTLLTAWIN